MSFEIVKRSRTRGACRWLKIVAIYSLDFTKLDAFCGELFGPKDVIFVPSGLVIRRMLHRLLSLEFGIRTLT